MNEITRYTNTENGVLDNQYKPSLNGSAISGAPALEQLNDKQKQQVCANVLSAIVGVAVYLKDDQVSPSNLPESMTELLMQASI